MIGHRKFQVLQDFNRSAIENYLVKDSPMIPALIIFVSLFAPLSLRYFVFKRPLGVAFSIIFSAILGIIVYIMAQYSPISFFVISPIGSYFILRADAKKWAARNPAQSNLEGGRPTKSRTDNDYIHCPYCNFEQWNGYKKCQQCGGGLIAEQPAQ